MKPRLVALALAATLLVGAGACSNDSGSDDGESGSGSGSGGDPAGTTEVLTAIADGSIVPAYAGLVDAFDALEADLSALCATPSEEALATAQETWRAAETAWQATRGGAVGPSMERRLMADVAFKARPDPVEDLIAGDEPIDTESLADKGSTFRGLSMTELLLFGESSETLTTDEGARTCELLVNVTPISRDAVAAVLADWTDADPPFVETFASGPEGDPVASVDELTNQVIACLTAIDDNGIRDLALAETLDDALSTRRDGPAAFTMAQHRALLASVQQIVEGDPDVAGDGLVDLVEARSPETAERLSALTTEAVAAFAVLPDSADASYAEHHDELVAASDAVAALKVLVTTEVASQLGITVRFSDADGDS